MEINLDDCYRVVMGLVDEAGKVIITAHNSEKRVETKTSDIDLLTETDQQVETMLIKGLSKEFPTHKFIGEEQGSENSELTDDPTWIIDPVDGTMNFVHGFPHFSISIALLVNKITEIAIIYNPVLNQKFTARRGTGAYYNDNKISVSGQTEIGKALITTEFGTSRDPERLIVVLENIGKIIRVCHGIRTLGSAALNMVQVALGGADCYYEYGIHAWDMAAGDLIIREAGGVTMDPAGGPLDLMSRRMLAASSDKLANEIVNILTQYYPLPRD